MPVLPTANSTVNIMYQYHIFIIFHVYSFTWVLFLQLASINASVGEKLYLLFSELILDVDFSWKAPLSPTAYTHILLWDVGVLHMSDHVHACMTALRPSGINTLQQRKAWSSV